MRLNAGVGIALAALLVLQQIYENRHDIASLTSTTTGGASSSSSFYYTMANEQARNISASRSTSTTTFNSNTTLNNTSVHTSSNSSSSSLNRSHHNHHQQQQLPQQKQHLLQETPPLRVGNDSSVHLPIKQESTDKSQQPSASVEEDQKEHPKTQEETDTKLIPTNNSNLPEKGESNTGVGEQTAFLGENEKTAGGREEMSWDWFWDSLSQEQKEIHPNLPQPLKDALWNQKRIQFQYSSTKIPKPVLNSTEIPRILHFVYVSPGLPLEQPDIPESVIENLDKWQEIHPEYHVVLWRNTDIIDKFPQILPIIRAIPFMSWVANILRYHVVEKYGGIYFDTDIMPLQSIEPIRRDYGPVFGNCQWSRTNKSFMLTNGIYKVRKCPMNNSVLGAVPHSKPLLIAKNKAVSNTQKALRNWNYDKSKYNIAVSGPPMWTKIVWKNQRQVNSLAFSLFEPCGWGRFAGKLCHLEDHLKDPIKRKHIYTTHKFKRSWYTKERDPNIIPYNASKTTT